MPIRLTGQTFIVLHHHAAKVRHGFMRFWYLPCLNLNPAWQHTKKLRYQQGLTLLELLVIISLLAALSAITVVAYDSVLDSSQDVGKPLAQAEMVEIAKAMRQFRADNGFYPVLKHPADINPLTQSFVDTVDNTTGALPADGIDDYQRVDWNIDTKRGWRGPYLALRGFAYVDVTGLHADVADITKQFAKPDPFSQASASASINWTACNDAATACAQTLDKLGGPYLFFGLMDINGDGLVADVDTDGDGLLDNPDNFPRRIVSLGADGQYGGVNPNDACAPNKANTAGEDDLVLCL